MSAKRFSAVVSRDESGTITIAPRKRRTDDDESGLFEQVVGVSGALCSTDVRDRRLTVTARIDRMEVASWWLHSFYGDDVYDAAIELSESEGTAETVVRARRTPLARMFGRLLLGVWLRRWWPASEEPNRAGIAEWLLDAELGALAWKSEEVYGSVGPARDLLGPIAPELTEALHRPITGDDAVAQSLRAVLGDAARASLDVLEPDHPYYSALDSAEEQYETSHAGTGHIDIREWIRDAMASVVPTRTRSDLALTAGDEATGAEVITVGTSVVDPAWVHPRSVSGEDDAVSWAVEKRGGQTWAVLTVKLSGSSLDHLDDLFATVHLDGHDSLGVNLERDGDVARGSALLPDDAIPLGVELLSWGYSTARSGLPDPDAARARRDSTRAFQAKRLRKPGPRGTPWGPWVFEDAIDAPAESWSLDDELQWLLLSAPKAGIDGAVRARSTSAQPVKPLVARDPVTGTRAEVTKEPGAWVIRLSPKTTGGIEVFVRFADGETRSVSATVISGRPISLEVTGRTGDQPEAIAFRIQEGA